MKHLKLTLLPIAALAAVLSSSCAATKGLGQDLQKVGNRIETRADASGGAEPDNSVAVPPVPTRPPAY